uniref:Proliferating cell nuclear antigen n=1 Tax=Panagrolaimus sp. ES5 TaxID=591445 RepID=A0AC34F316_9BILA
MRFSAAIDDKKSFEALIQAATCASAFLEDEELTLKILPDGVAFVCATGFNTGYYMEIKLFEQEIFSAFRMEGISDEKNVIIMQLKRAHFMQILKAEDEEVRIKLVKRDNLPKLTAEFKGSGFLKTIPVKMVKNLLLADYMTPSINEPIVGLIIKPMYSFEKLFKTFLALEVEATQLRLVGDGNLFVKCRNLEGIEFTAIAADLESVEDVEHHGDTDYFRVRVEVMNKYFNCMPAEANHCEIRVTDLNQIVVTVKHYDADYNLYMSALRDEAFED